MTGYSADCPLCTGYLACTGAYVANGTTSFNDKEYGDVVILASSKNLPCGSIVIYDILEKYGKYFDKEIIEIFEQKKEAKLNKF